MKVKEESEKAGLKLNIQKMKIMASDPITSWQIDGETMETGTDFIFLGSKITVDGYCSHKTKRCLLLGRKAMTNLDNILKSRDITLPTKVCIVKAMVFLVVMYGCKSWTIKKAECWRNDAFELWCWRRPLESPLDFKESQLLSSKGNRSWISLEGLKLKLQYFGHLMPTTDSLEKTLILGKIEGRRRRGQQRMRWLKDHHWLNGHEFEQAPGVGDDQGSLACCSPWGFKELDTTEQLNWTTSQVPDVCLFHLMLWCKHLD